MQTTKQIEDLIKGRQAEGQAVISAHETDTKSYLERKAKRQQQVNQIEGMILQLRALLPKQKREPKATKKKKK